MKNMYDSRIYLLLIVGVYIFVGVSLSDAKEHNGPDAKIVYPGYAGSAGNAYGTIPTIPVPGRGINWTVVSSYSKTGMPAVHLHSNKDVVASNGAQRTTIASSFENVHVRLGVSVPHNSLLYVSIAGGLDGFDHVMNTNVSYAYRVCEQGTRLDRVSLFCHSTIAYSRMRQGPIPSQLSNGGTWYVDGDYYGGAIGTSISQRFLCLQYGASLQLYVMEGTSRIDKGTHTETYHATLGNGAWVSPIVTGQMALIWGRYKVIVETGHDVNLASYLFMTGFGVNF